MDKKTTYPLAAYIAILLTHLFYYISSFPGYNGGWTRIFESLALSFYFEQHEYLLGLSYALAGAFTVYALQKFYESGQGIKEVAGGLTLSGMLYFAWYFIIGCCGSPMIAVYLTLFASYMGLAKAATLLFTIVSVSLGMIWLRGGGHTRCRAT